MKPYIQDSVMRTTAAKHTGTILSDLGTNDSITLEDLVDDFATFYLAGESMRGLL